MSLNTPSIFWLDRSERARRMARDVVHALHPRQARDELGLGAIRDAIAEVLSPGTSTIMTRARYFLFVPAIYREIERKITSSTDRGGVETAWKNGERALLQVLIKTDPKRGNGVIGREYNEHKKLPSRLPSEIYWSGLIKWGILRDSVGRERYHAQLASGAFALEDESGKVPSLWDSKIPSSGKTEQMARDQMARDNSGLSLTTDEAKFLLDRIENIDNGKGKNSFLRWMIDHYKDKMPKKDPQPWWDAAAKSSKGELQQACTRARWFSALMHGAQLVYNHLVENYVVKDNPSLAEELGLDGHTYTHALKDWIGKEGETLKRMTLDDFWRWPVLDSALPINDLRHTLTRDFVGAWYKLVNKSPKEALGKDAEKLITRRETLLKPGRSRLTGAKEQLEAFKGQSGAGALDFRFAVTKNLATDIARGLKGETHRC